VCASPLKVCGVWASQLTITARTGRSLWCCQRCRYATLAGTSWSSFVAVTSTVAVVPRANGDGHGGARGQHGVIDARPLHVSSPIGRPATHRHRANTERVVRPDRSGQCAPVRLLTRRRSQRLRLVRHRAIAITHAAAAIPANKKARFQGFRSGRHWARTSDPSLSTRSSVRTCSPLYTWSAWLSRWRPRANLSANANERRSLPCLPRAAAAARCVGLICDVRLLMHNLI